MLSSSCSLRIKNNFHINKILIIISQMANSASLSFSNTQIRQF